MGAGEAGKVNVRMVGMQQVERHRQKAFADPESARINRP